MKIKHLFRAFQFVTPKFKKFLPGAGSNNSAFSLVEIVFAIGICGFCFALITALIPIGLKVSSDGIQQTTAARLANTVVGDLRATPIASGSAVSPFYGIQLLSAKTSGTASFFLNEDGSCSAIPSKFRATVMITPPTLDRTATMARIWITWPGYADPTITTLPGRYSGSFETEIGLDRN